MASNEPTNTDLEVWRSPDYADPALFDEQEVTVGSGPFAVQGTIALPHGEGPHPAAVVLAGGGPFDRDGTAGPNKNLKDIAWGLASRGVAVLRFDKVTYTHREQVAATPEFTPTEEYVPHAVAGIEILRRLPTVNADLVFVIGHSMGGKFAPRVAAAGAEVAGLVVLAGDTVPMQWSMVRVIEHLTKADPATAALLPTVEAATEHAKLVDSPDLSPATPAAKLPFGMPAPYWLDMRAYDPVAVAATLDLPMLFLQGERDYQLTIDGDLAGWRAGLAGKPDVTFRVYTADDHMFFPGTGPSMPEDYAHPHHVDPEVITDIADWLKDPRSN
ncbi:dienelactone hydrolase family protein [Amycolatopsis sp. QT-25]|uniref:alpha/beta hydrolase family protein n=1 Tax=Amycolatopsis sp. QT-25 TaxID=3034022 RepID=UPI0023EB02C8|nr:alpha/beta fold hydrolase [Amycolatopsis sp. QT-25]WET76434.1 dienelactone hydrolase family protein [Amycolatopsis sp. QT-25]